LKKLSALSQLLRIRAVRSLAPVLMILIGLVAALPGSSDPAIAGTKKANNLCNFIKITCARKPARSKTVRKATSKRSVIASQKRKAKQQKAVASQQKAVASMTSKAKPRKTAKSAPVIVAAPPHPVTKPRRKPTTSQMAVSPNLSDDQKHSALVAVPRLPLPLPDRQPLPGAGDCRAELLQRGVEFRIPDHVEASGQCAVADPVLVTSVAAPGGRVKLPEEPLMNCAFARKFTTWLSDIAAPVIGEMAPARLESLSTGPGYECRNRNGDSSGKISEHAFGNAIDISGITLANRIRIEIPDVADPSAVHHRLLMALRLSACGYFTTVLGPGFNAAHASHYHFDLGQHGKSDNYRICN
jgi:hypothetical protein